MRTETDTFGIYDWREAYAWVSEADGNVITIDSDSAILTKDQARQFAMQLLEMCEPEAAPQPDFNFVKESDCE